MIDFKKKYQELKVSASEVDKNKSTLLASNPYHYLGNLVYNFLMEELYKDKSIVTPNNKQGYDIKNRIKFQNIKVEIVDFANYVFEQQIPISREYKQQVNKIVNGRQL